MTHPEEFTVCADLESKLDAQYWDGHMLGDSCPPPPEITYEHISLRGCNRFARNTLREHLESSSSPAFPLETLNKGSTFSPQGWQPGTVILFDREILRLEHPNAELSEQLVPFQEKQRALRPTDLHPNLGVDDFNFELHRSKELGVKYIRSVRWGVVTPTKSREHILQEASTSFTWKSEQSGRVVIAPLVPRRKEIAVGETTHGNNMEMGQWLSRTNIVRICAYGTPETQRSRKWLPTMLGKLAQNTAQA